MNATDTVFVCLLHVVSPWASWIDLNLFHSPLFFSSNPSYSFPSGWFSHFCQGECSGKRQHTFPVAVFTGYSKKDHRMFLLWKIDKSLDGRRRNAPPACEALTETRRVFQSPFSIRLSSETSQLLFSILILSPLCLILPALFPSLPSCFLPFSTFNTSLTDG